MDLPVFTVSELNNTVKSCLESYPVLQNICVTGEISNYKLYPSGHHYFSLKDTESSVSCVMFKGSAVSLRFRPENGMSVLAFGRVSVYPRDGKYQMLVSAMMPSGAGDLQLAFEQLKTRLSAEGLFNHEHKKILPHFPRKIAVVTSPVGAAVRDIIRILGKRWPMSEVLIIPVRVQGAEAPGEISKAISYVNRYHLADVIITGRGGGSLEDLWAFNDETVARAIYASEIPVISAVGHEPDVTISDYTADLRAATPSNAAELCVPNGVEIEAELDALKKRLCLLTEHRIADKRNQLLMESSHTVMRDPQEIISLRRMDLDMLRMGLCRAAEKALESGSKELVSAASSLDALSPLKVLSRGYSIAEKQNGNKIRSVSEVHKGDTIKIRLSDGKADCTVHELEYF